MPDKNEGKGQHGSGKKNTAGEKVKDKPSYLSPGAVVMPPVTPQPS